MTDGINAAGHGVQAASRKAVIDGIFTKPQFKQLPPRNHPVLTLRQSRYSRIGGRAKPSQPAYIAG